MTTAAAVARLLAALLALTHPPAAVRARVAARRDAIVAAVADASAATGVPPEVLLSVAWLESHAGTDPASGGSFGAPRDAAHRHRAGGAVHAARVLARGYARCGTWLGAVHFFRCGWASCTCPRLVGYEAPYALALVARLRAAAAVGAGVGGGPRP